MAILNTSYFLEQVKLYGSIPSGRYTDAEILKIAGDAMLAHVVPMIVSLKEEFYVQSEDQAITDAQANYLIPYRAMGLSLREIKKIRGTTIVDIPRISPEDIVSTATGTPEYFYLEGHNVVLYPTPSATVDALRMYYFRTPSNPVTVDECAIITAINTGTGVLTAAAPSTWTTADAVDLVSKHNGHRCLAVDLYPSAITATDITIAAASLPSTLSVGDYVALAGEAPFLQVPDVCFDLVVRITAHELLLSLGDQAGAASMLTRVDQLKTMCVSLLTNRVQGAMKTSSISLI